MPHPLVEYYNAPSVAGRISGTYQDPHNSATAVESQIMFEMGGYKSGGYGFRANQFNPDPGKSKYYIGFLYGTQSFNVTTSLNNNSYTGEIVSDIK